MNENTETGPGTGTPAGSLPHAPDMPDAESMPARGERKLGRPPKGSVRPKLAVLPKPPQTSVVPPLKFFRYWHDTDRDHPNRLQVYVYRRWPVVDRSAFHLPKSLDLLIVGGNLSPDDVLPESAESTIMHRFGSGDYKLIMTDGGESRKLMTSILTLRDPDHPPVVEPLDSLVLEDPANRPYLEDLRRRGIRLPGEPETDPENSEDDMTKVTTEVLSNAMDRLVDHSVRMSEAAIKTAQEDRAAPPPAQPPGPDALATSIGIITSATKMGNEIVNAAISKVGEIQAAHATASPVDTVTGFLALAKQMNPSGTGDIVQLLMAREQEASRRADEATKAQLTLLTELVLGRRLQGGAADGLPAPPPSMGAAPVDAAAAGSQAHPQLPLQPKSPLDMIRELAQVKDDLQDLLGTGGGPGEDGGAGPSGRGGSWKEYVPMLIQGSLLLANTIASAFHNAAVARTGLGTPLDPAAAARQLESPPQPGDGLPPAPVSGRNQQSPAPPADSTLAAYHQFLATLKEPLIQALKNGESGSEFAAKMIDWQGEEMTYEFLRELGADKIMSVMSTYPPIWEYVSRIPGRFQAFMDEFMAYGDEPAEGETGDERDVEWPVAAGASPAAGAGPAPDPLAGAAPVRAHGRRAQTPAAEDRGKPKSRRPAPGA